MPTLNGRVFNFAGYGSCSSNGKIFFSYKTPHYHKYKDCQVKNSPCLGDLICSLTWGVPVSLSTALSDEQYWPCREHHEGEGIEIMEKF
jgi:hypothetical protein